MGEPISVGAAAAATGTIIKVIQQSFAYAEVPHDVRAFQYSIETFNGTLQTAKRLRRVKSHLMDDRDKLDVDQNIQRGVDVLNDISGALEACRKDLSNKGTVSFRNRLLWLMRDHQIFLSRTHTVSICHQSLNNDISGMRQCQGPPSPPPYESLEFSGTLRPPSRRRPISASKEPEAAQYELHDHSSWMSPCLNPDYCVEDIGIDEEVALEKIICDPLPTATRRARKSFMIT